jgi:hypothetical protein
MGVDKRVDGFADAIHSDFSSQFLFAAAQAKFLGDSKVPWIIGLA